MMTNYKEMLNINTLGEACGVAKEARNLKQKKAIRNIKYCANDQWQFVNSWYDCKDEDARQYMMNARELFNTIYDESQKNVYDEGSVHFGTGAEAYMKDVRFCGKEFLQKVCFYYTAQLLEESVEEVEGTEADAQRVYEDLKKIKNEIYGIEIKENPDGDIWKDITDGDDLVETLAERYECSVKTTRKGEKWISLPRNIAIIIGICLKSKESKLECKESRTKRIYSNENVELVLSLGSNPYLWSVKKI